MGHGYHNIDKGKDVCDLFWTGLKKIGVKPEALDSSFLRFGFADFK